MNALLDVGKEFAQGMLLSLKGFFVVHKLDRIADAGEKEGKREASVEPGKPKLSVLQQRRNNAIARPQVVEGEEKRPSPERKINRIPAYVRVAETIATNCLAVILLWYVRRFTVGYSGSASDSNWKNTFQRIVDVAGFALARFFSILWFSDVAGVAQRYREALRIHTPHSASPTTAVSDLIHAFTVEIVFLVQTMCIQGLAVPIISPVLGFIFTSVLNSLYCFDYAWMSRGYPMASRLYMVERRWPFHLGFGCILTLVSTCTENFVFDSSLFAGLFPFFIVSAFVVEIPRFEGSEVGRIHFFSVAQSLSEKLSLFFFFRIAPVIESVVRAMKMWKGRKQQRVALVAGQ